MATVSILNRDDAGSQFKVRAAVTLGTYATSGVSVSASDFGLAYFEGMEFEDSEGYTFDADIATGGATALIKAYRIGTIAPTGTIVSTLTPHADSAGTPAGTNSAPALTMDSYTPAGTNADSVCIGTLDLATPVFSGTGYATVGQVVTTTDNQTMTLNQCAGMWLIGNTPTEAPALIVSNTAVTGAPAVLTVIGTAPVTDAGGYKIVRTVGTASAQTFSGTPATLTGSVAAPAFTGAALGTHSHASTVASAFTGAASTAGSLTEVSNGVNLSAVIINVEAVGK